MNGLGEQRSDSSGLEPIRGLRWRLVFESKCFLLCAAGIVFALAAIGTGIACFYLVSTAKQLQHEGKTVAATVTNMDTVAKVRTETTTDTAPAEVDPQKLNYRVFYVFSASDGKTYNGSGIVAKERWEALKKGDTVEVVYLPNKPTSNRLSDQASGAAVPILASVTAVCALISLVLLALAFRSAGRQAHLLSKGTLAQGKVVEKTERSDITVNGRHPFLVRFCFAIEGGESQDGKETISDFEFAETLAVGGPVNVIYLATDPGCHAIFREKWMRYFRRADE